MFGLSLEALCERDETTVPRFIQECLLAVELRGELSMLYLAATVGAVFYMQMLIHQESLVAVQAKKKNLIDCG